MNSNYKLDLNYIKNNEIYYRDKNNVSYNEKIADKFKDIYNLIDSGHKLNENEKQIVFHILIEASLIAK